MLTASNSSLSKQESSTHPFSATAMVATRAQKRSAADSRNPLCDRGVLQTVLSFVGPGHHLFVAAVSKGWREVHATLDSVQLTVYDEHRREITITCDTQVTLYSSVFTSPSRVELAYDHGLDCTSEAYLRAAGKYADVATIATAHDLGMPFTATTMAGAAHCNKLAEVQYLHSQGCAWPEQLLEYAARSGHFELLRWCHEHGCDWHMVNWATTCAAQSGNVELMAWVLEQPGAELTENVMRIAVSKKYTAMCQYLLSQRCPWDERATAAAVAGGHVDLLCWLVDNGCPSWDAQTMCRFAVSGGSVAMLRHMQQQGALASVAVLTEMLGTAAWDNQLAAAKWLREQGAEWPTSFEHYAGSNEVLAWARCEGCPTRRT
jgi:hypothetical protein